MQRKKYDIDNTQDFMEPEDNGASFDEQDLEEEHDHFVYPLEDYCPDCRVLVQGKQEIVQWDLPNEKESMTMTGKGIELVPVYLLNTGMICSIKYINGNIRFLLTTESGQPDESVRAVFSCVTSNGPVTNQVMVSKVGVDKYQGEFKIPRSSIGKGTLNFYTQGA